MNVDLILTAPWIVPVEPHGVVLEGHALVVHEGRIVALLPEDEARAAYRPDATEHFEDHVLIPGLINAHTHAAMSLLRGYADDLPLMEWLQEHIWPAEGKWVGPEFVHDGTLLACAEMIRGGVTCFNDMYFFPLDAARAIEAAGMRAALSLVILDFPTAWAENADEYFERALDVHGDLKGRPLLTTTLAPHAPYSVSDDSFGRIVDLAEFLDVPIHIHVHETEGEVTAAVAKNGMRPLARLKGLGLMTDRLLAVHMTQLTGEEIGELAASGARVVHCPEANLKLASGFCPVQTLLDAGVDVALGTDGPASNNDLDMFGEMRTAALLAKGVSGDATAVPAARALHMATLAGARALGIHGDTGSLEPGKSADIVAVDLGGLESRPVHDPISQLVYVTGRDRVTDVWVAGRRLLQRRNLTTVDEREIIARARSWQERMSAEQ